MLRRTPYGHEMTTLTMIHHGIEGRLLGIVGACEYALASDGQIYRRRADEAGTYGGWRWECATAHPGQSADPIMAELAALIAGAS